MFKFPLKRHHHNNQNHNKKSASSPSNEGFIFIRCGHNSNNNHYNNNNNNHFNSSAINKFNSLNDLSHTNKNKKNCSLTDNENRNIISVNPNPCGFNQNVAKSTVQTSWRPQLPLPKEVLSNESNQRHYLQSPDDKVDIDEIQIIDSDMERFHLSSNNKKDSSLNGSQVSNASHNGGNTNKKWSFGRLFRRKKEIETESSSEEDRKAGFLPLAKYNRSTGSNSVPINSSTPNKKTKSTKSAGRGSKLASDNISISATNANTSCQNLSSLSAHHVDNEFFLPVETVPAAEPYYQNNKQVQALNVKPQQQLHHSHQYLSHVPQTQQQLISRSALSLDRRSSRSKQRAAQKAAHNGVTALPLVGSSSEEEIISLNSTTFSKYRSDESIHSGGQGNANGQSRRSRAARNERYYKRLSRDGEISHGQVPVLYAQPPTQRWKTQPVPLSIYQAPKHPVSVVQKPQPQVRSAFAQNIQYPRLRNTNSLQHMAPYVQWGQIQQQQPPLHLQNTVNDAKRSISYDSHIHLQNANGKLQNKPIPPPPPPRDPLRRVNVSGHLQDGSSSDLRPISYAFDQTGVPILPATGLHGRCVSDDKIWAQQPHYQSIHSLNITPNQGSQQTTGPTNRRFITRAERDAQPGKKSLPNGLDFHYVADATPRSRKPIHLIESGAFESELNEPPSSGILRTTKSGLPTSPSKPKATEFWKRLEGSAQIKTPVPAPRGRDLQRSTNAEGNSKPRSVSSSRATELSSHSVPMYSEVYKPKKPLNLCTPERNDAVDGVIFGSLHIKPTQENGNNFVEIRNKDGKKAQSMPNHYHRRSGEVPTTPNKYEEYVNERREQNHNPVFDAPQPPLRKPFGVPQTPQFSFPRKKPANLEEAINELEAIYRSLGFAEEPESKKERVPTPNDFEKYALAHADEYDEDDSPAGEPDPVRDDVAYRNIKLANLQPKTAEKQPPFGIPLGPIVPAPLTDYLHVTPKRNNLMTFETKAPDVVKDDLAVRALRKDPVENKDKYQYPTGCLMKKNRATRTQSANIYALIQRDAAKPSGGDLHSYLELTKSIDRSGSMSDLHKHDSASDIPTTLRLLQSLREQELEQHQHQLKKAHIPFRHPSQGGAICQLPQKLASSSYEEEKPPKPVPKPRTTLTPEPQNTDTHKMEEALNKIAHDAQESSKKLTEELKELRKEALITASKPKKVNAEEERLVKELQEIEKVSQAAKKCGEMLLNTLPDNQPTEGVDAVKTRKLHKEDKLIKAIDQVSEAANKVCEKILQDIVTTEPPVVVQEAIRVTQKPGEKEEDLVMPALIKKLDPINSTNIEAIARRCMRQLSDLADSHDYDNLNQTDLAVATSCNIQQVTKDETTNDLTTSNLTETRKPPNKPKQQQIEEIDQIMRECEDQAKQKQNEISKIEAGGAQTQKQHQSQQAPKANVSSTTASSFSSSSDCLAKSSSPSGSRRFSSSVTSFNPYSSSDYIKSPSSEFHAPSTDPIKTFSTTSYDVQSTTSATPNLTTISTFSCSPSPPALNLTPISNCSATIASNNQRGRSSSPSQYNSSEELAMIFGIEEKSKAKELQNNSGKDDVTSNATTPELLLEQETPKTNAASPPECSANNDIYDCCAKTNDCLLLLNPSSYSHTATNNASFSPISSTSPLSASRLETIPEYGVDSKPEKQDGIIKISANLNKIYNSKLSINMDKFRDHSPPQNLTPLDSLNSLEETSSNPDSGNVSLADFPLGQHNINNAIQLNTNFNTRFEVRNCFKTEVTIAAASGGQIVQMENDFPRLPTAEELANSLKENSSLEESLKKTEEFLGEQNILREKLALAKEDHELLGERIIWARDEIMAEVKALELKALKDKNHNEDNSSGPNEDRQGNWDERIVEVKAREPKALTDKKDEEDQAGYLKEIMAEVKALRDNEGAGEILTISEEDREEYLEEIMAEVKAWEQKALSDNENDAEIPSRCGAGQEEYLEEIMAEVNAFTDNEDDGEISSSSDKDQEEYFGDVSNSPELDEPQLKRSLRKHSIVIETPQLEMNIMEEKINYKFSVAKEDPLTDDDYHERDTVTKISFDVQKLTETLKEDSEKENHLRFTNDSRLSVRPEQQESQELPGTSSKANASSVANVLGEERQAVDGLTLLEQLVVACTLGIINTDDLVTLCLIVIGIIIVIALALF